MPVLRALALPHAEFSIRPNVQASVEANSADPPAKSLRLFVILNDCALHLRAEHGMVRPYRSEHLQPCSIDLTLGNHLKVEASTESTGTWNDIMLSADVPYLLQPGEFILAHTAETICIPDDCCGDLVLRSSAARAGFDHCLSGLCDPGFEGQLTLELRNNLRNRPLEVRAGMRICQLVVQKLVYQVHQGYRVRGNYQHQKGATESNLQLQPL